MANQPRAVPLPDSSSTSQVWATSWSQVPDWNRACPARKVRRFFDRPRPFDEEAAGSALTVSFDGGQGGATSSDEVMVTTLTTPDEPG